MSNNFIKTIDNSSAIKTAISLAIQPLASMAYVSKYVSVAIKDLATSSSVVSSIGSALLPYSKTTDMNSAISTAIQPLATSTSVSTSIANSLIPYSTTTDMNTAITASSLIPLNNNWSGTNSFNNNVVFNSNLQVLRYSYTLEISGFPTAETIYLYDEPINTIIPVSSAVFGKTYRIVTVGSIVTPNNFPIPPQSLYNDAYYFNNSYLRTGGVYLGKYDAVTNNMKYGLKNLDGYFVTGSPTRAFTLKIWNIPFTMGMSPTTIYFYSVGFQPFINPSNEEPLTNNTAIPYSPLTTYAKVTINPPVITSISSLSLSYLSGAASNLQTQITNLSTNLLSGANSWTGNNTFRGVFNSIQSADTILPVFFSQNPSFSMTTGMVYSMNTQNLSLSSLSLTNIPTTPQQTYVFTFVLQPINLNSPWYLKPPNNSINIIPIGGSTTTVPVYGVSSVVFPSSYQYILQTITVVNTSTTTSPSFISFLSVSAY